MCRIRDDPPRCPGFIDRVQRVWDEKHPEQNDRPRCQKGISQQTVVPQHDRDQDEESDRQERGVAHVEGGRSDRSGEEKRRAGARAVVPEHQRDPQEERGCRHVGHELRAALQDGRRAGEDRGGDQPRARAGHRARKCPHEHHRQGAEHQPRQPERPLAARARLIDERADRRQQGRALQADAGDGTAGRPRARLRRVHGFVVLERDMLCDRERCGRGNDQQEQRALPAHQLLTSPGFFSRSLKPFHARFTMCAATASRPGLPTSSHHSPTTATIPTSAREYTGAIFGS